MSTPCRTGRADFDSPSGKMFWAPDELAAAAAEISGAGATFPYPVYAKWADTYRKETGVELELSINRFRWRY